MSGELPLKLTPQHVRWSEHEPGSDAFYTAVLKDIDAVLDANEGPWDKTGPDGAVRWTVIASDDLYMAGIHGLLVGQVRTADAQVTSLTAYEASETGQGMRPIWRSALDQLLDNLDVLRDVEVAAGEEINKIMPLPRRLQEAEVAAHQTLLRILPAFAGVTLPPVVESEAAANNV